MAASRRSSEPDRKRSAPATTDEGRESQLISLASDLAEKQLRDGTASSQVISHYLKLGSTRAQLEDSKLKADVALLEAKIESMASAKRVEELYSEAIAAFRGYAGLPQVDVDDY